MQPPTHSHNGQFYENLIGGAVRNDEERSWNVTGEEKYKGILRSGENIRSSELDDA